MCGRVVYVWDPQTGRLLRKLVDDPEADPETARVLRKKRYNVPPGSHLPIVSSMRGAAPASQVEVARWGFPLPQRPNVFNTRIESAPQSSMWSPLLGRGQCLFFVKGFYEWTDRPWFIQRADGRPMLLAGLVGWRTWRGEALRCASIVTSAPNDLLARVHDRMPVIIEEEDAAAWLAADADAAVALATPAPEGVLAMHQVDDAVNSTKNDHEGLIRPARQTSLDV